MIEKANETFWQRLASLPFVTEVQLRQWRQFAEVQGATWVELCHLVQQDSCLGPNHLNLMANPESTQPVQVGNFLINDRVTHPLDWESFAALHLKLQKVMRLVFLPTSLSIKDAVLRRARQVAALPSLPFATVLDIESCADRLVLVLSSSTHSRLCNVVGTGAWESSQNERWAADLIEQILYLHRHGLAAGGFDPTNLVYNSVDGSLSLDDLVCNPWVGGDELPLGLTPREETCVVSFRAARKRWLDQLGKADVRQTASTSTAEPIAGWDWLEFSAWLDFFSQPLQNSTATREIGERWKLAAAELAACASDDPQAVADWGATWFPDLFPASTDATTGPSVSSNAGVEPSSSDALSSCPGQNPEATASEMPTSAAQAGQLDFGEKEFATNSVALALERETGQTNLASNQAKPSSLASRNSAKREIERRRKLVTAVAVVAPFPIFLLASLLAYFLWPAAERLPDRTSQNVVGELPDDRLPNASLSDKTPSSNSPEKPPGKSPKAAERSSVTPPDLATDTTSDAEMLMDLNLAGQQDSLLGSLIDSDPSTVLTELENSDTRAANDTRETLIDTGESEQSTDANIATTSGSTQVIDLDDPYISYTHVQTRLNVVEPWRELRAGPDAEASAIIVSLGQLNRVTAKRTMLSVVSTSGSEVFYEARIVPTNAPKAVQTWELRHQGREQLIALVKTTSDGHLQMQLLPVDAAALADAGSLALELYYGDREISHRIDLAAGQRATFGSVVAREAAGSSLQSEIPGGETSLEAATNAATAEVLFGDDFPDLGFDPRTATLKTFGLETPAGPTKDLEWRFWLVGKPLRPLEKENSNWQSLRYRGNEQPYVLDELFDLGSLVLTLRTDTGNRTRIQGKVHLATVNGLTPFKKDAAAELAAEAERLKQTVKLQYDQLKATRAKPGEGDKKQIELGKMESVMRECERVREALAFAIEQNDAILESGLAFELLHREDDSETILLRSQGRPKAETAN